MIVSYLRNDANEANHKLSQQVQQLQLQLQQTQQQQQSRCEWEMLIGDNPYSVSVPPAEAAEVKKIRDLNNNLQMR